MGSVNHDLEIPLSYQHIQFDPAFEIIDSRHKTKMATITSKSPPLPGSIRSQDTVNSFRTPRQQTEEIKNISKFIDLNVLPTSISPTN